MATARQAVPWGHSQRVAREQQQQQARPQEPQQPQPQVQQSQQQQPRAPRGTPKPAAVARKRGRDDAGRLRDVDLRRRRQLVHRSTEGYS